MRNWYLTTGKEVHYIKNVNPLQLRIHTTWTYWPNPGVASVCGSFLNRDMRDQPAILCPSFETLTLLKNLVVLVYWFLKITSQNNHRSSNMSILVSLIFTSLCLNSLCSALQMARGVKNCTSDCFNSMHVDCNKKGVKFKNYIPCIFDTNLWVSFNYQPAYSWLEINILIFLPRDEVH